MRGFFDYEEPEPEEPKRDTEVTVSTGGVVAIACGLLLLGALCFSLGYITGHRSSGGSPANRGQTAAPDQEPLQASGAVPKPPAAAQAPVAPSPANGGSQPPGTTPAGDSAANPGAQQGPGTASGGSGAAQSDAPSGADQSQPQVRPALPGGTYPPQPGSSSSTVAAPPGTGQLMVQVAAVSHDEDADVLVGALRKRGYNVSSQREPSDSMIHVRVGPFATRDEATKMARKLLDDGYNAVVQP